MVSHEKCAAQIYLQASEALKVDDALPDTALNILSNLNLSLLVPSNVVTILNKKAKHFFKSSEPVLIYYSFKFHNVTLFLVGKTNAETVTHEMEKLSLGSQVKNCASYC